MERPTKFLFLGVSLGLLICLGGYLSQIRNESRLADLVKECEKDVPNSPIKWDCDPEKLFLTSGWSHVTTQKAIVESWLDRRRTFDESLSIAAVVFITLSLPYAWYFLLRRIRELGNAITGK